MFGEQTIQVLLIEDEEYDVQRVMNTLQPLGGRIAVRGVVSDGNAALNLIRAGKDQYDIVIMDFQISGGLMGEQLIRAIREIDRSLQIIVITKMTINITDFEFASSLMKAGAFWYCTKYPVDIEEHIYQPTDFILSILNAYDKRLLEREQIRSTRKFARTIEGILANKQLLGTSPAIEEVRRQITKCAESAAHVLIAGPSGTGKELVAHNIHYTSARRFENFVPVNCGSLPQELIESELFGYEKGAFTGANTRKLGLFEVANHGSLFLDEISELPLQAQVKLLRVIQDGEIEKIGRTEKIKVDVRIIAATNKDLQREVEAGRFREDLFYRLNVLLVSLLPLCQHREDIPLLINHFLRAFSGEVSRPLPTLDAEALRMLVQHDWPGNVRELKNVLQRLILDNDGAISAVQVERALGRRPLTPSGEETFTVMLDEGSIISWKQMERTVREKYFRYVRLHSTTNADAAKKLGLAPPNYHRMCKELGIK